MKNLINRLGYIYNDMTNNFNQLTTNEIKEIRQIVTDKFLDLPCNVSFEYGNVELDNFEYVKNVYRTENILLISADNNNSELLPNNLNLWFRAWHDYIHIENNYLFGFEGEFYAYLKHIENQSDLFKQVLFSEIVLQTAYFETFNKFAEFQKVVLLPIGAINILIEEIKVALKTQIRFGGMKNVGLSAKKVRVYA
jgi:hypothetical protein